jgi:biopolymer transport protein TolR
MQALEQRRSRNQLISSIDAVGFLSIMLVLLYIVIAPSMGTHSHGKDVDMVKINHPVSAPGADRDDAMVVAITRDGKLYFGNDEIELSSLTRVIRERVQIGSPRVVYFKPDGRARYKYVREVLEAVQANGLEKVVFLVEQRKITGH